MSDGQVIAATMARARRRLIAATFVRWTCCAIAVGVAGLVAGAALTRQPFAPGRPLLVIGAVALVVGIAASAWRRPTLAQTAAALDARLGLADLAIAAHSLRDSSHPMAQLVVRDARLRLAAASLPDVIPMPRRLATWTSGASMAAVLLGLLAGGDSTPGGNLVPAGGTGRIVSGGGAPTPRMNPSDPEAVSAEVDRSPSPRPQAEQRPQQNGQPRLDTPSRDAQGTPSSSTPRGRQAGAGGPDPHSEGDALTAARDGNAGRGAGNPQGTPRAGAGGVQQGRVQSDGGAERSPLEAEAPASLAAIRQAAQRAEAAMSRDEVPPRLKPVVRRYFQAMQSESGQ